jgi:hypothetical protein
MVENLPCSPFPPPISMASITSGLMLIWLYKASWDSSILDENKYSLGIDEIILLTPSLEASP